MKTLFTLLVIFSPVFAHSAILTVDNTTGAEAMYPSISSAISAASNGDTIQVHPAQNSYGDIIVNKKVVLVGPGYFSRPDGLNSRVDEFEMRNGASGSIITGFYITGRVKVTVDNKVDSIGIINNFFFTSVAIEGGYNLWNQGESDNWLIEGNAIIHDGSCGGCKLISLKHPTKNDNWIIRNNFIQGRSGGSDLLFDRINASSIFLNNIIIYRSTGDIYDGDQATFKNNIFYATSGSFTNIDGGCTNCVYENNLTYSTSATLDPLPGTDNIDNQDPLFESISGSQVLWNRSSNYQLQSTSPGHNAGTDNTDVGIYGAGYNWRNAIIPIDFPRIEEMTVTNPIVPKGQDLIIKVKAKKAGL